MAYIQPTSLAVKQPRTLMSDTGSIVEFVSVVVPYTKAALADQATARLRLQHLLLRCDRACRAFDPFALSLYLLSHPFTPHIHRSRRRLHRLAYCCTGDRDWISRTHDRSLLSRQFWRGFQREIPAILARRGLNRDPDRNHYFGPSTS